MTIDTDLMYTIAAGIIVGEVILGIAQLIIAGILIVIKATFDK